MHFPALLIYLVVLFFHCVHLLVGYADQKRIADRSVGATVGAAVGATVGAPVGATVGAPVGATVGAAVGAAGVVMANKENVFLVIDFQLQHTQYTNLY